MIEKCSWKLKWQRADDTMREAIRRFGNRLQDFFETIGRGFEGFLQVLAIFIVICLFVGYCVMEVRTLENSEDDWIERARPRPPPSRGPPWS